MPEPTQVIASGEGSVAIGGDVIKSIIVTGSGNRVFVGDYERLSDAYLYPGAVFQRVRLDHFVGREWLTAEVDAFLRDYDRGVFVLEAAAGLGKTTYLAHLVKERGYIHHFVEQAPGQEGIATGLRNLAAQLIRAWELDPYLEDGILPGAASRPDYLERVLAEAAAKRDTEKPGEKIVLVVDALDEAGTLSGQNVLGLPKTLPSGVYLIVSQRPIQVEVHSDSARRVFKLQADQEKNLADMRAYLEAAARWDGVSQALHDGGYSDEQFVSTLLEKCQGVWVYLHYVVAEIDTGQRRPLDLDRLPANIWQYYAQYWWRWRSGKDERSADWDRQVLPLLSTLAAAQEALSFPRLCGFANVQETASLRRMLNEDWRPFLAVDGTDDERRYRLYHASLREFLSGRLERAQITTDEIEVADELARATRSANARIADHYLSAWGGLDQGLPHLQPPYQLGLDDSYGLQYVAAHLEGAGRISDLDYLLSLEYEIVQREEVGVYYPGLRSWLGRLAGKKRTIIQEQRVNTNTWYSVRDATAHTDAYLSDISRAWRQGEVSGAQGLGLTCRYALISTSLNSLSANIPAPLLVALVRNGIWTSEKAVAFARQTPNPSSRVAEIVTLAPCLTEPTRSTALVDALVAISSIHNAAARTDALAALGPHLSDALLKEALALTLSIEDEVYRVKALEALLPHLPERLLVDALLVAQSIHDTRHRAKALAVLVPILPASLRSQALSDALRDAHGIGDARYRALVLAILALHVPHLLLNDALPVARTIEKGPDRGLILAAFAPRLQEPERHRALEDALTCARSVNDGLNRVEALSAIAMSLPRPASAEVLREAVMVARTIENPFSRVKALAALVLQLAELNYPDDALALARSINDCDDRTETLAALASHLARLGYLDHSLAAVNDIRRVDARPQAIASLIPHIPESARNRLLADAFTASRLSGSGSDLVKSLVALAPYLPQPLLDKALEDTLNIPDDRCRSDALAALAPRLAEIGYPEGAFALASLIRYTDTYTSGLLHVS